MSDSHAPETHPAAEGPLDVSARPGRGVYSQVMGHVSACPRCAAREKVSMYVLDSIDDRYSHRCTSCGEPSPLGAWTTPPMAGV